MGGRFMDTNARPGAPRVDDRRAQLRAEALRQLRWQQQQWQQIMAQAAPGAPVLTSLEDRVWFHGCLDMLRHAGEEVPQALYRHGSIIPARPQEGRETASISLTALVADVARVLEFFALDADEDPVASAPAEG
jgi:hypothetical protein